MDPRVSLVTLAVEEVEGASAFYRNVFGWKAAFQNEQVAFFQLNGVVLSLYRRDLLARDLAVPEEALGPGGCEPGYNVRERSEVDQVLAAAERAGGSVVVPAHEAEWGGYSGHFADPDGHRWEVAWNPRWTISEDGNTRL